MTLVDRNKMLMKWSVCLLHKVKQEFVFLKVSASEMGKIADLKKQLSKTKHNKFYCGCKMCFSNLQQMVSAMPGEIIPPKERLVRWKSNLPGGDHQNQLYSKGEQVQMAQDKARGSYFSHFSLWPPVWPPRRPSTCRTLPEIMIKMQPIAF